MLASPDRREANKGNLHACERSKSIPGGIAHIESVAEAAHTNQNKGVKRQETGDEGVTAP